MSKLYRFFLVMAIFGPILAAPSALQAAKKRARLTFVPFTPSPKVISLFASKFTKRLRMTLRQSPSLQMIDQTRLPRKRVKPKDKALQKTLAELSRAKTLLGNKKYRKALKLLKKIHKVLLGKASKLPDLKVLVQVRLLLARAYYGQGYNDNGDDEISAALKLNPKLNPTADPKLNANVQRMKKLVSKFPTGTLRITSPNTGAVFLNGYPRGETPLNLVGVSAGKHILRVTAPGFKPWTTEVTVEGGKAKLLSINLEKDPSQSGKSLTQLVQALNKQTASGAFGGPFEQAASALTLALKAGYLFTGYVWKIGGEYRISGFLYVHATRTAHDLKFVKIDSDMKRLDMALILMQSRIEAAIKGKQNPDILTRRPVFYLLAGKKSPVVKTPVVKTPVVKTPVVKTPVVKTPVVKTPVVKTPILIPELPPILLGKKSKRKKSRQIPDTDIPLEKQPGDTTSIYTTKSNKGKVPLYKKWWFWTAIGAAVVVVGVTTGTVLYLRSRGSNGSNFSAVATW